MAVNRRRPPPHPLLLPGSQQRDPTPAFGKIATYSHRLPPLSARRRWSGVRRSSPRPQQQGPTSNEQHSPTTRGMRSPRLAAPRAVPSPLTPAAESARLLRAIAVAEVGMRQPFRRLPRQREDATAVCSRITPPAVDVTVDIQPATPRAGLPPTQEEETRSSHHQPATLHSILVLDDDGDDEEEEEGEARDDEAVEIIRFEPQPGKGSFHYLQPDLSGASGLSIHHFEAHGRSVSSSSTETLVDFSSKPVQVGTLDARRLPTLPGSKVPQDEPGLMMHNRSASAPIGPAQPPQHLAELFEPPPRAYLCPWELDAPPPAHHIEKHHHHHRRSDFENSASPEKPLPQPISAGSSKPIRCCEGRWQRKHAVTAALVLLTVLILTDLVALNIRVWSLRDAYYDE